MNPPSAWFVVDVEATSLHGIGFAAGIRVVTPDGVPVDEWIGVAPLPERPDDWVFAHVLPALPAPSHADVCELGDDFWARWRHWQDRGAWMAADVPWPVEARWLTMLIDFEPVRAPFGPYPLVDISSVRLGKGLDPMATEARREGETPEHNPLSDARQSARLLIEALKPRRRWGR